MIIRKVKGRGERISLPVSPETKSRLESIQKTLREKGYEIEYDGVVLRIIKSIETAIKNESGSVA